MLQRIVRLARQELVERFESQLQLAGSFHREPGAQDREQDEDHGHHQKLHGQPVFPGMRWIGGRPSNGIQERIERARQEAVEKCGGPEFQFSLHR